MAFYFISHNTTEFIFSSNSAVFYAASLYVEFTHHTWGLSF